MMKKAYAVLLVAACALPAVMGAQNATDAAKMLQIFSSPLKTDGGTFQVIILNDKTVEAIFGASPEMLVRCRGRDVETRPIAGTAGRGETGDDPVEDAWHQTATAALPRHRLMKLRRS